MPVETVHLLHPWLPEFTESRIRVLGLYNESVFIRIIKILEIVIPKYGRPHSSFGPTLNFMFIPISGEVRYQTSNSAANCDCVRRAENNRIY